MNYIFVKTGSVKDVAGVCAQPKSGLTWGNTVQQEPRKMSKSTSTMEEEEENLDESLSLSIFGADANKLL